MVHAADQTRVPTPPTLPTLPTVIDERREPLARLCREFHVQRLSLIGSSLREDFHEGQSDLDFVVEVEPDGPAKHDIMAFFSLRDQLQALFVCAVDLAPRPRAPKSRFAREVDATEVVVVGDRPEPIQTEAQRARLRNRSIHVRKAESYLEDILTSVEKLTRYVAEKTYEDYLTDDLLRDGVERNLITIGEAITKIRKDDPELPPRLTGAQKIIGFRNVLVPMCYDLDNRTIWQVLEAHLPILEQEVKVILKELDQK